jgi:lipoprotein Spr
MGKCFFILLFLFSTPLFAQQHDTLIPAAQIHTKADSLRAVKLRAYFAQYGLNPDSAASQVLFREVYAWKGTPYRHAGHSKKGIDCSGFVEQMYASAYGISIAGSAKTLYDQCDTISKSGLQEGDLLFFKIKKGQISHVAIYLGNNKFAHATVHGGVMIDDLDEEYYRKYFYCGGRLGNHSTIQTFTNSRFNHSTIHDSSR